MPLMAIPILSATPMGQHFDEDLRVKGAR